MFYSKEEFKMKKFKKILAAAAAAAITLTATGVAASAYQSKTGGNAEFRWGSGYAEMINRENSTRYAAARVEVWDDVENEQVNVHTDARAVPLNKSAVSNLGSYPPSRYISYCSGNIRADGTHNSPIEWSADGEA